MDFTEILDFGGGEEDYPSRHFDLMTRLINDCPDLFPRVAQPSESFFKGNALVLTTIANTEFAGDVNEHQVAGDYESICEMVLASTFDEVAPRIINPAKCCALEAHKGPLFISRLVASNSLQLGIFRHSSTDEVFLTPQTCQRGADSCHLVTDLAPAEILEILQVFEERLLQQIEQAGLPEIESMEL